ncbi:FAD-dependent oxidoreductase [Streptomyces bambusae]|uniref:FAD-dependent oxidoreductase n=1 Tax=Streptomyces bambusae TaxID=1550616 RepID=UPI001CFD7CCF|nr:FAD-dependent oxidoreductase [Streptomyces bambusae]MCB5166157.1 FAD-dependent oxidoreductase [Streptomyces bambusae]
MDQLTVIGGGFAGLVAAISAAEAGAKVTVYESHHTLGGRARTADGPYRTNEGPHALYNGGPHWGWLTARDLVGPLAPVSAVDSTRLRVHSGGRLRMLPPLALFRLARRPLADAPVDRDFHGWAAGIVGEDAARAVATSLAVALYHHDVGSLSAAFVQERLRRVAKFPPEARFPRGGWQSVIDRMAARARELGVTVETGARITEVPAGRGPVVVATSLAAARTLLGDPSLTWESGRTVLLDLAMRSRRGDLYALSDLDEPAWIERFTTQDKGLAPAGEELVQAQLPIGPDQAKAVGIARAERLLDLGFRGWRERTTWRREAVATGRTGAVDLPGTTWRDRPAVHRGDGVYLAGDQVAAPGVLCEVSFNSAIEAVALAMRAARRTGLRRTDLDLKSA